MLLVHWLDRCLSCCLPLQATVALASVSDFRRSTSRELFQKHSFSLHELGFGASILRRKRIGVTKAYEILSGTLYYPSKTNAKLRFNARRSK